MNLIHQISMIIFNKKWLMYLMLRRGASYLLVTISAKLSTSYETPPFKVLLISISRTKKFIRFKIFYDLVKLVNTEEQVNFKFQVLETFFIGGNVVIYEGVLLKEITNQEHGFIH